MIRFLHANGNSPTKIHELVKEYGKDVMISMIVLVLIVQKVWTGCLGLEHMQSSGRCKFALTDMKKNGTHGRFEKSTSQRMPLSGIGTGKENKNLK